ncbi:NUDIX hydrolase [Deinococcus aquiradiocola]|uniref:7,8-dihydro-8-oxoguanine triphosphatase n=1 Tax=Deinococcus aquiradiocola TaxID=393059 RepID=A0A917UNL3_9DEIO|nr:8-oxo-dGTP diphosphatase [Deinococcus aquiradiocola]GGJ70625.1 7,8-dihydro-8-oxoguanine triphosphatase [Deinococcus aquiradiocola]
MPYTPIIGTLAYVLSEDRQHVLLIHRTARPGDEHLGKYNGLGGKLEADESVTDGIRRELMEEANLTAQHMTLRGTVSWPGFGKNGEDWLGFIFVVDAHTGTPPTRNEEGTLAWHPVQHLLNGDLPVWEGDRHFLPLVFDDDPRAFHGVMPYRDGRPVRWTYDRL